MSNNWDPTIEPMGDSANQAAPVEPASHPDNTPPHQQGEYGQYEPVAPQFQPPYAYQSPQYLPAQPPYPGQPPYPAPQAGLYQVGQPPYQTPYPPQPPQGPYPPVQPQPPYPVAQTPYPQALPGYPMSLPNPYQAQTPSAPYPGVAAEKGSRTGVIVGVVIAVVVLALVGVGIWWMVSHASNQESTSSASTPTTQQSQAGQSSATVDMEGYGPVEYAVTGEAELSNKVGEFYDAEPGMVFVNVPVTVTYHGSDDMFYFDIDDTALMSADGTMSSPDLSAEVFSEYPDNGEPFWMAILEPGESISGLLIYQVDSSSTDGAVLMVGVTTADPVTISIGL